MVIKLLVSKLYKKPIIYFINMRILTFQDFLKKYILKDDTMSESDIQRVYNIPVYPRDSKIK